MSKNKYIEDLLSKYWECNTSLEEENILRSYFLHDKDIPKHLQPYKTLFIYQQEEKKQTLSTGFEDKLMQKMQAQQTKKYNFSEFLKIAACFLLFAGLAFWIYQKNELSNINMNENTLAKIEDTKGTMMKALCLISDNMQKSEAVVEENFKYFELLKTKDSVNKK